MSFAVESSEAQLCILPGGFQNGDLENRYTISEISLRLGYSSIHYFSKSFNMKYHMSPSEFVKQNCQSSV